MDTSDGFDGPVSGDDVDAWIRRIRVRAEQSAVAARDLRRLTATGHDPDRVVTVRLTATGALADIELGDQVRSQPTARTREQILAAVADGRRALSGQVAALAADAWGPQSPTAVSLIAAQQRLLTIPEPDDGHR
jgi:hypothetical protein